VVFKEEILKVSNKYTPALFISYMKKNTLFTEDSNDNNFNNKRKGDDISPNLTKSDDKNENDNFEMFTQNSTNIAK
jgi:hypothetical protein